MPSGGEIILVVFQKPEESRGGRRRKGIASQATRRSRPGGERNFASWKGKKVKKDLQDVLRPKNKGKLHHRKGLAQILENLRKGTCRKRKTGPKKKRSLAKGKKHFGGVGRQSKRRQGKYVKGEWGGSLNFSRVDGEVLLTKNGYKDLREGGGVV